LIRGWRIARALLASQYALMLEYRVEILLWALAGLVPFVMLAVWIGSPAGAAMGMGPTQLARYFLAAFIVRQFTVAWVLAVFEEDALQGRLSPYLLQPLHPLWRYLASHIAEQAIRLPIVMMIAGLFFLVLPWAFWLPTPQRALLTILATMMAFLMNFLIQCCMACLCFWSDRVNALERLIYLPMLFLSGLAAPLEAYPPEIRRLAEATPFPLMVNFPARLLDGGEVGIASGFVALGLWISGLLVLLTLLWRCGVRRYGAMGA
jgi:ABC-2 type transport system permease protein